jgi:hypothetical protein
MNFICLNQFLGHLVISFSVFVAVFAMLTLFALFLVHAVFVVLGKFKFDRD